MKIYSFEWDFIKLGTVIIILILAILIIPKSWALFEGQILTQEQIDGFDTNRTYSDTRSIFECRMENTGTRTFINGKWYYFKQFSCYDIERTQRNSSEYLVYRNDYQVSFPLLELRWCVDHPRGGRQLCFNFYRNWMQQQTKKDIMGTLENIQMLKNDYTDTNTTGMGGGLW